MHIFVTDGKRKEKINTKEGQTILQALLEHGITVLKTPCGGRGKCGKCTVTVLGEGEVTACTQKVRDGMQVVLPKAFSEGESAVIVEAGSTFHYRTDGESTLLAACDIGTTTIVCHLLEGASGKKLATVSEPNAHRSYGAAVLSSIQAAENGGLLRLHEQMTVQIDRMLGALLQAVGERGPIARLAVAGNTVMCHLLAGVSPARIAVPPFMPEMCFGTEYAGEAIGLPVCKTVYIAPAVSGYVGPDITCALLASVSGQEQKETLLLDIGTNGEMVLGHAGSYLCCAAAAGPAFEGAEITMGMPAEKGAISRVRLDARRIRTEVIAADKPEGICGSGLIDALSVLLRMGLVESTGLLKEAESVSVAYRKYLGEYKGERCVWLTPEVCLTQGDIRNLQLAKAAVAAGIQILMKERGITCEKIERVVLAGGFGSYLDRESAAAIGLIPRELADVTEPVGNAAGEGAVSAAVSKEARKKLKDLKSCMQNLELSTHPDFSEYYLQQMEFGSG